MPKRAWEDTAMAAEEMAPAKRSRLGQSDRFSRLSDEILLQVLGFLPLPSLLTCQRLSRRFNNLAGDSELWKQKYYHNWVLPRARRLRRNGEPRDPAPYTPNVSRWLDHGHLAMDVPGTNWKKQYRLKHNWSTGACRVTEVEVARPPIAPVIVKLESGIAFAADSANGLRAWSMKMPQVPLADCDFDDILDKTGSPTAITAMPHGNTRNGFAVVVGFENGGHALYLLNALTRRFERASICFGHGDGAIIALASTPGYVLVLTQTQLLSLHRVNPEPDDFDAKISTPRMRRVTSLQASNIQAPISLSVRNVSDEIIVSIAYSFTRIGSNWSIGIQELRLNDEGETLGSRVTTSVDSQDPDPLESSGETRRARGRHPTGSRRRSQLSGLSHSCPPTSISYSHPYLLLSHADNTLTMYLVVSTSDKLMIRSGRRLWGHTSSVESVQVSERGKAVSVSPKGDDIRIWELESVASALSSSQRALKQDSSIRVSSERRSESESSSSDDVKQPTGTHSPLNSSTEERALMRGLVGFDDEQVLVLRQQEAGNQTLGRYDFT